MAENKPRKPDPDNTGGEKNYKKKSLNARALSRLLCTAVAMCAAMQVSYGQTEKGDSVMSQRLDRVIITDSRVL